MFELTGASLPEFPKRRTLLGHPHVFLMIRLFSRRYRLGAGCILQGARCSPSFLFLQQLHEGGIFIAQGASHMVSLTTDRCRHASCHSAYRVWSWYGCWLAPAFLDLVKLRGWIWKYRNARKASRIAGIGDWGWPSYYFGRGICRQQTGTPKACGMARRHQLLRGVSNSHRPLRVARCMCMQADGAGVRAVLAPGRLVAWEVCFPCRVFVGVIGMVVQERKKQTAAASDPRGRVQDLDCDGFPGGAWWLSAAHAEEQRNGLNWRCSRTHSRCKRGDLFSGDGAAKAVGASVV